MNVNGYKHRRHTQTNKHLLRERWEYRLGTVSTWIETLYLACVCISHSPIHFMFKVMVHEFVVKIEQIKRKVNCYREIVIILGMNVYLKQSHTFNVDISRSCILTFSSVEVTQKLDVIVTGYFHFYHTKFSQFYYHKCSTTTYSHNNVETTTDKDLICHKSSIREYI